MKKPIILGIDVGKMSGWAVFSENYPSKTGCMTFKSLKRYQRFLQGLVTHYEPDLIVSCRPTRFARVIAYQSKLLAIVELVAEESNLQFYEGIDSEMKKLVLKNGIAKKPEIIEWATNLLGREVTEHEADALMFTHGMFKKIE